MSLPRIFLIACLTIANAGIQIGISHAQAEPEYSLDEAVSIVKKTYGGRVLRATPTQQDGRATYEIRILTDDGLVRTISFDAETGEVE